MSVPRLRLSARWVGSMTPLSLARRRSRRVETGIRIKAVVGIETGLGQCSLQSTKNRISHGGSRVSTRAFTDDVMCGFIELVADEDEGSDVRKNRCSNYEMNISHLEARGI